MAQPPAKLLHAQPGIHQDTRIFSGQQAAFPELPLASTQNLTVPASPYTQNTPNTLKQDACECLGHCACRQRPDDAAISAPR